MSDPALFACGKEWNSFCLAKGAGEFRRSQSGDSLFLHRCFYTLVGGFILLLPSKVMRQKLEIPVFTGMTKGGCHDSRWLPLDSGSSSE